MCLGIPGRIDSIDDANPDTRTGRVVFGGVARAVNLTLVPEAEIGDFVIVHAGFALNRLDEEEARRVFELIEEMEAAGETSDEQAQ
jgi:hydrogenase expression/formation protein HypC